MIGTVPSEKQRKEQFLPSEDYVRQAMPQTLGTFGMTMIFLLATFFINNPASVAGGGMAAFTYWGIGTLVFLLPCVIATAQLGAMFFNEGSLYNWTQKALGSFWSFFVGVSFWVSGLLGMIASAGIAVTFLQGFNSSWLSGSGAQGTLIVFILIFSAIVSIQGFRMLQYMVNIIGVLMLCVVGLLGFAALIWLLAGHPIATNFAHGSMAVQPGNYVLFSTVILAFLGANVSMTLGGEIGDRKTVTRHLFRGGLLVLGGYLLVTLALLVVVGPHAEISGPFAIVNIIDLVFGKFVGNITAACVIAYFLVLTALFNSVFARILLVAALDRRLPVGLGKLDENRVPLNAVIFQTLVAVLFTAIVFLLPYLFSFGNPANLTNELFTVTLYAHSMIWAISSSFLFIDLLVLYLRDPRGFHAWRIFPMPVLWASIIVAPLACVLAIIVTLSYSPIPQLIPDGLWGGVVGGLTLGWLIFAGIASMVASGEASWEDISVEEQS
jgi:amino acid transporter